MPKSPKSPERRIETQAKNKTAHPGKVDKPSQAPRRTKAEVQADKEAKAQAKEAAAEARQQSINRTAEFEHADIAHEDIIDATPRPTFTPRPRSRRSQGRKTSPLTPFTGTSDIVCDDDNPDESPFLPTGHLGGGDGELAIEIDSPPPPPKKKKAKSTSKATAAKKNLEEETLAANRKRSVADVEPEGDLPVDSREEQPQEPKPKKAKVKMREEIKVATTKIVENEKEEKGPVEGNKYAKMVSFFM